MPDQQPRKPQAPETGARQPWSTPEVRPASAAGAEHKPSTGFDGSVYS